VYKEVQASRLAAVREPDRRAYADVYEGAEWPLEYFEEFERSYVTEWHSYVYWRRRPFDGEYITVADGGRRQTWNVASEKQANMRIWMFGGSTMWGTGARDAFTIASYVAKALAAEGFACVFVENFGESGYVTTQSLIALMLEVRTGNIPDLVVFYDGHNNVYAAFQNREAGIPQNEHARRREFGRTVGMPYRKKVPLIEDGPLVERAVKLYFGDLRLLEDLAGQQGFEALGYWQPVALLRKPLTPYEAEMVKKRGEEVKEFFEMAYGRVDGYETPDMFRAISRVFATSSEPYYVDPAHVGERGNAIVAREMMPDILKIVEGHYARRPEGRAECTGTG